MSGASSHRSKVKGVAYRKYLLCLLTAILALNFVERLALGILLQSIKTDFQLSDTQLGLLTGLGFALFYSVMGLPIARWADRGNRVTIITVTTAMWGLAVMSCAMAGDFLQLLIIRVGVAVGEAGCIPLAHSLIADYFDRAERPRAVGMYMQGMNVGIALGYFFAGWLNEPFGWRLTFVFLGLPGVVLSVLAWSTLKEPRRDRSSVSDDLGANVTGIREAARSQGSPIQPSLRQVSQTLWRNKTFRHLLVSYSVVSFFSYGITQWKPAFFIRSYGLHTGELGTWFAAIYGLGGLVGTYLGGELASRRAANNEALQLKAMAISYTGFCVVSVAMYLSPDPYLAFVLMALGIIGISMTYGPLYATIQTLVPQEMRATAIAVVYLFVNLIGMGLGPLAAGAMSDAFHSWAGNDSLRYSLLALCPGYLWSGWHLWRGSKTVAHDLRVAKMTPEDQSYDRHRLVRPKTAS